ncbi:MAG: chorismate mutase [Clostridia bacterium]|nr:chorismate mutase [Clostridia bacterium]
MNELEVARKMISETDAKIAELFEKRMQAAELVAKYKKEHGLSILDTSREKELISRNAEYIHDTVIREYYVRFLKETMAISRDYQSRLNYGMRVAYSGVPGAFAYIAARRMFPEAELISYPNFEEAYSAVENGLADTVVLPIENSFAGDVGTVMDLLFSGSLYVNQVVDIGIEHNLIACDGASLDSIRTVVSHEQALSQCAEYIKARGYRTQVYPNTALAAKYVKELGDVTVAAVASDETAGIFGLKILASKIHTSKTNTTRFASFSRAQHSLPKGLGKMNQSFILVFTVRNEAGALAKTLDIIGAHGFNMRNLRSRPMKELMWSYYFFVEAEGNINSQDGKDMLRQLSATCDKLKLAGVFYSK